MHINHTLHTRRELICNFLICITQPHSRKTREFLSNSSRKTSENPRIRLQDRGLDTWKVLGLLETWTRWKMRGFKAMGYRSAPPLGTLLDGRTHTRDLSSHVLLPDFRWKVVVEVQVYLWTDVSMETETKISKPSWPTRDRPSQTKLRRNADRKNKLSGEC